MITIISNGHAIYFNKHESICYVGLEHLGWKMTRDAKDFDFSINNRVARIEAWLAYMKKYKRNVSFQLSNGQIVNKISFKKFKELIFFSSLCSQ